MRMRVRIRSRKGVVTMIALLSIEAISGSLLQESWRDRLRPNEFELSMTRSAPRSGFVQQAVAADGPLRGPPLNHGVRQRHSIAFRQTIAPGYPLSDNRAEVET